jgi:hypothetical protein
MATRKAHIEISIFRSVTTNYPLTPPPSAGTMKRTKETELRIADFIGQKHMI